MALEVKYCLSKKSEENRVMKRFKVMLISEIQNLIKTNESTKKKMSS
jgi:hypothetical protein